MARTAVVAGTATAVAGRVQRRQAERFATRDANIYAEREQAYAAQQGYAQPQPVPPAAAPAPAAETDLIGQLERLGKLRDQGVLTEEEFAAQKAKLLG